MALRISSVLLNAGRDDDRISGLMPTAALLAAGGVIGGQVITQDQTVPGGQTFKLFDGGSVVGATNPFPWGLVIEPTHGYTGGGASGDQAAGRGFDTLDYARGGLYTAFHRPGNLLDAYDDQRDKSQVTVNAGAQNNSAPFVQNRTWNVGDAVFATAAALGKQALLDNVNAAGAGGARIGWVRAVAGSGADLILTIELDLSIA
jgi:hypothetical protein